MARIKGLLKRSEIGARLCFYMNNIRYITNTTIGTGAIDKLGRFCRLPQDDEPINVITRFPVEQPIVTGVKSYTTVGPLSGIRETWSHKNIDYTGVDYGGAGPPARGESRVASERGFSQPARSR